MMDSNRVKWHVFTLILFVGVISIGCSDASTLPTTTATLQPAGAAPAVIGSPSATSVPPSPTAARLEPALPAATETLVASTPTPMPTATSTSVPPTPTPQPTAAVLLSADEIEARLQGLTIDEFFQDSFDQLLLRDPELLTALGLAGTYGLRNDRLNDRSDAFMEETYAVRSAILELLGTYDREAMTPEQRISADVYTWYLDDLLQGYPFRYHDYPVHHFLGYHDNLNLLFTDLHPLENRQDAEDYVARLGHVREQIDQLIEGLQRREEAGIILPRFSVDLSRRQLAGYLQMSGDDPSTINRARLPVYTAFEQKILQIEGLSREDRVEFREAALAQIDASFIPGYLALIEALNHLYTVATDDDGVWKLPDGDAYYAWTLRHHTSTELSAAEIHELGLSEVERIHGEMRAVFDQLGYPADESLGVLMQRAIEEAGTMNTASLEGQRQVVAEYERLLADVDQRLYEVIDVRPSAALVVVPSTSGGGGGFYIGGSLDGSRPGAFYAGVGASQFSRFGMATVAFHEGVPGHHLQVALAMELDLPLLRNVIFFNSYDEGWALYAERLAWELGMYDDDPLGNLARLQYELLRAVRMVTDTGIHAFQWTRQEAKAYMAETMGGQAWAQEADRYIVLPAQSTGYMVGMLKILALRQMATERLGDQFDLQAFHRVVLMSGSLPLEILERVVEDYAASAAGS